MGVIQVKICCIATMDEALTAIRHGASALGLVGHMPSGPGIIDDDKIRVIAAQVPPLVDTFLLTSKTSAIDIINHHQKVHTTTIQIVDKLSEGSYQQIRDALPGVRLVQVIHVLDESSIEEAVHVSPHVDALLLDSGNPNLTIKELGGTGRTHDWAVSRRIREQVALPVFLAGGITAINVREAIETVQPHGVDLCSGVRTDGRLDPGKLAKFFEAVHAI